jgi:hypothetical protein
VAHSIHLFLSLLIANVFLSSARFDHTIILDFRYHSRTNRSDAQSGCEISFARMQVHRAGGGRSLAQKEHCTMCVLLPSFLPFTLRLPVSVDLLSLSFFALLRRFVLYEYSIERGYITNRNGKWANGRYRAGRALTPSHSVHLTNVCLSTMQLASFAVLLGSPQLSRPCTGPTSLGSTSLRIQGGQGPRYVDPKTMP